MDAEAKLIRLGIALPDFTKNPFIGLTHGKMRPFRIVGNVLYLSGHVPDASNVPFSPGRLGDTLTTEQGYAAARVAGINVLAAVKQALGDLSRASLLRSLNFVICTPTYHDVHKVSSGLTDLLAEVLGPEKGIGCRATIGAQALTNQYCFETWCEFVID